MLSQSTFGVLTSLIWSKFEVRVTSCSCSIGMLSRLNDALWWDDKLLQYNGIQLDVPCPCTLKANTSY